MESRLIADCDQSAPKEIWAEKNNISYKMLHQLLKKNRETFHQHLARVAELQELIEVQEDSIRHCLEEEKRLLELFQKEFCCSDPVNQKF